MAKVQKVSLGKKGSFNIKKGALHKKLGIPEGQKIPASRLKPHSGDSPALRREKASAKGLKAMHHGGGGGKRHAMHRGESGSHMNVGAHEGRVMGTKKR